jgi:cellulose synthase/poly-beta-1,6-N-acetylglucosamine synthase-like glycosyltransferase
MNIIQIDHFSNPSSSRSEEMAPLRLRREAFARTVQARRAIRSTVGASDTTAPRPLPVEIAFLATQEIPLALLQYAAALARRQGVSADSALIAEGLIGEETFYRGLAAYLDAPFLDEDAKASPADAATLDAGRQFVRLVDDAHGLRWLFAPRGEAIGRLIDATRCADGRPLFAITTPSRFLAALRSASPQDLARRAAFSAERSDRDLCVRRALRPKTLAIAIIGNAALLAGLHGPFEPISIAAAIVYAAAFFSAACLRLFACAASFDATERAPALADAKLPHYSIVIALYREACVVRQLTRAIDDIDYPRAKLDVKFVIEHDDAETAQALRDNAPLAPHEIIVAPRGAPRTKPRALNVAMPHVRGGVVAVFDAEDQPEHDQLKKAAAAFAHSPQSVACLQASLCIHNSAQNWMTALFAIDYAALFDVVNKGVANMGLPLFLGGTSNHFRFEALREVGFWDAFNVTEDADLGLRLARAGFVTKIISSRTFEEAPASFVALVRQRTRWLKGWMQTGLVHCRDPWRLVADLGFCRALAVAATLAGGLGGPLLGPAFAIFLIRDACWGRLFAPIRPLEIALSALCCFVAIAGSGAIVWPFIVGMQRQSLTAHWRSLLYLPLWTAMLSLAAWRAIFELCLRPFHWEKTDHGVARTTMRPQVNSHCLREKPALNALR